MFCRPENFKKLWWYLNKYFDNKYLNSFSVILDYSQLILIIWIFLNINTLSKQIYGILNTFYPLKLLQQYLLRKNNVNRKIFLMQNIGTCYHNVEKINFIFHLVCFYRKSYLSIFTRNFAWNLYFNSINDKGN